jgi:hypothetical protein
VHGSSGNNCKLRVELVNLDVERLPARCEPLRVHIQSKRNGVEGRG